jgi:hypothetical protein
MFTLPRLLPSVSSVIIFSSFIMCSSSFFMVKILFYHFPTTVVLPAAFARRVGPRTRTRPRPGGRQQRRGEDGVGPAGRNLLPVTRQRGGRRHGRVLLGLRVLRVAAAPATTTTGCRNERGAVEAELSKNKLY